MREKHGIYSFIIIKETRSESEKGLTNLKWNECS